MSRSESDLQHLLAPIDIAAPCGPNLEYDPDFIHLESLVEGKPEQQYGDAVIPAEEPDWLQAGRQAEQLLMRSKDLRIALHHLRALTHTQGLAGLAAGLELFAELVQTYWATLHPALHLDGELDPLARYFSISALSNSQGFMRDMRNCPLLKYQSNQLTLREVEQVAANTRSDTGLSRDQVSQIVTQALESDDDLLDRLDRCSRALEKIDAQGRKALAEADIPDLGPVRQLIDTILRFFRQCTKAGAPAAVVEASVATNGVPEPAPGTPRQGALGNINSRQDAERAIELVCQYFNQHEPTNPAPLLLKRALKVMSMSFMDIVRDMAPDAISQVQTIAGPTATE